MINRTDGIYELSKMGVSEAHQAKGIGRQLMEHCIHWAKAKNLPAVMIETSTKLTPAIKLYQRMGFIEVPSDAQSIYERADYRLILPLTMTAEEALAVLDKQTCNA